MFGPYMIFINPSAYEGLATSLAINQSSLQMVFLNVELENLLCQEAVSTYMTNVFPLAVFFVNLKVKR